MPPKPTVSRSQIIESALEIVRDGGLAALSARAVAQQLGCSTQPVYRVYESMEQLKADVMAKAGEVAMSYLVDKASDDTELPFLQVGLGSLRFAQQEPQLFQAVAQSGPVLRDLQQGKPPPDFIVERMRREPALASLSDEQIGRIHTLLWFFSQGLATLFLSEAQGDPMPMAQQLLMQAGRAVISFELNEKTEVAGTGA